MTMIIHQDRRRRPRRLLIALVIITLLYVIFFSPVSSYFSGVAHTVSQPVWKARDAVANTFVPFTYFASRRDVYLENQELQKQIDTLLGKISDRDLLREENIELKQLLGRDDTEDRVLATVLAKPNRTPYDTMIIDTGERHGVSEGDSVMLESTLLGEIDEVLYGSSKVVLYTTAGRKTQVSVGENALQAEAVGLGGGMFEITLPRQSGVQVGDTVSVASIDPRVLGVIITIERNDNDAFERILVRSFINPYTLTYVEVVR